ncbi:hypothetical protein EL22_05080 [Halostagnicola sp. A56]|uniref:hypothetical protein n=1 Tax=Halostagnicola sp. A56 TaxID=1495067 RepID=UPI0004A04CBD|nr:hypothetical protein [Halostagnicola sp. A56]KDE58401.1 hypothetical protein EL22_05080 [Halostagnicola sp. A56]
MSEPADISCCYVLTNAIDLLSTLEAMGVQYLDINDRRALVIFTGGILNLESDDASLTSLTRVKITVYDLPLHSNHDKEAEAEAGTAYITKFIDRVTATAEISYKRTTQNDSAE